MYSAARSICSVDFFALVIVLDSSGILDGPTSALPSRPPPLGRIIVLLDGLDKRCFLLEIPAISACVGRELPPAPTNRNSRAKAGTICPWVFQREGRRIRDFRDAWTNACTAVGCPGRIPHDFRRTAVRNLVDAGVPEKTAMLLTGHKTRAVFDRYHILEDADLRAAVARLAAPSQASRRPQR